MDDKVSMVDSASGFSLAIFFSGENLVMQTSIVLGPKFRRRGQKSQGRGVPPVEEGQALDSIMWLSNFVNKIFSSKPWIMLDTL